MSMYTEGFMDVWFDLDVKGVLEEKVKKNYLENTWQKRRIIESYNVWNRYSVLDGNIRSRYMDNSLLIIASRPMLQDICGFAQNMPVILFLCDREGNILDSENNLARILGADSGRSLSDLLKKTAGGEEGASYKDQSLRLTLNCTSVPIHDKNGEVAGFIEATCTDGDLPDYVLRFVNYGVKFIEDRMRWMSFLDSLYKCTVIINSKGEITYANKNAVSLFRAGSGGDLAGKNLASFIKDGSRTLKKILSDQFNAQGFLFSVKADTQAVTCILVTKAAIKDPGGYRIMLLFFAAKNFSLPRSSLQEDVLCFDNIVGKSQIWNEVVQAAKKVSRVLSSVLLEGESGTGKEVIAQAIHVESGRTGAFVPMNCGSIPKELIESELFGYEEGSFTGARKGGRVGKLESADGGTLFLDEIGEMPLDMQVRLLRFLQDKVITRVGGTQRKHVDVRIIAATNRNLQREVEEGRFRKDLYYRLNVINISLPPLRSRKDDIPLLARFFADKYCFQFEREPVTINDSALNILCRYRWPGNVRELSNAIERAIVFTDGDTILPEALPPYIFEPEIPKQDGVTSLESHEKTVILATLKKYKGNISEAARELGISRNTIYRKIR